MKILVSANNPGGTHAILPVVKALLKDHELVLVLEGVAQGMFKVANFDFITVADLDMEKLFTEHRFDLFFASSSSGDTIDKKLTLECKARNITSVYVLDFWSNYWQRFSSNSKKDFKFLPNYICVMDELAKQEMIDEGFPEKQLVITGNPYFNDFTKNITTVNQDLKRVLFISQPNATDGDSLYTHKLEDQILLDTIDLLPADYQLIVRLHPRDKADKYQDIINDNKLVKYEDIADLEQSISASGLLIGVNSTVMFQAALADKAVISYQPLLTQGGTDALITNKLGLSRLVVDKNELSQAINNYVAGKELVQNKQVTLDFIKSNATNNIINFISDLKK